MKTIRKTIQESKQLREGKNHPWKRIENNSKINKPVLLRSDVFAEINKRKMEIDYRRRYYSLRKLLLFFANFITWIARKRREQI